MAVAYVNASSGATDAGDAFTATGMTPAKAGNIIILQVLQDGTTSSAVTQSSATNITALNGTANTWTYIGAYQVGNSATGIQHLWVGRSTGTSAPTMTGGNTTSEDLYYRMYEFSGVCASATTTSGILENSTAGTVNSEYGTSTTCSDVSVTTTHAGGMALNFVALSDDAMGLGEFAGESGGDWVLTPNVYSTSSGTDGTIALMRASLTSAGTINGGSDTITSIGWGVVGFALIPEFAPTVALGTPNDNASVSDTTPDLKFTGTDADSDTIDYQVQVDTSTSFNSQAATITNDTSAKSITTGYAAGGAFNSSYTCGVNATLLVVSVGLWQDVAGTGTVSGIKYNGTALTQAKYLTKGAMRSEIWYLSSPTTGSSCTLAVTISGDTDQRNILVSSWNGVSTSSPLGNTGSGSGTGSPISHSITQGTAGSLLVDSAVKYGTEAVTKGASQTLLQSDNTGSIAAGASYEVNSSTGSYTLSWTTTGSNDWSHTSAEFKAGTAPLINALSTDHTGFSAGASHPTASGAEQTYTVGDYDDFNDNSFDATRWTRSNATQVTEQNSELELASTAAAGYYSATSAQKINLTGRFVSLKWVDEGNTAITSYEAYPLELVLDSNNMFSIYNTSGTVYFRKTVSGSPTTLASEAYSATGHLYLRIRESSGTVYFDKSSDGSTWNNVTSTSVASSFAVTSLDLVITVGTWQVEGSTTIMKIDDVKYGYQLADGTYYWRVRGIDPSGGNTWGAWSPGDSTLGYDHFHLSSGPVNGSVTQVAASLTLTGGTQTVVGVALVNASVTQTGASLTLSSGTQTVAAKQVAAITQTGVSMTLSTGTQTVAAIRTASITQTAASLTLTSGTQAVASTQICSVAQTGASLTLSTGTQSVASAQTSAISQTAASLTLSGGTQSVEAVVKQNASITQTGASLVLSGGTQTVAGVIIASASVTQVSAPLTLSVGTQVVNSTQVSSISQTATSLTLTGGTQTVESTGIASILQTGVALTLTGGTQSVISQISASVTQVGASLVLSGGTQSIATLQNAVIQQIAAQLSLSSGTQSVVSVATGEVTQVGANLVLTTGTPVISTATGPLPTYYPDMIFCDGKLAIQLDEDQYMKL